MIRRGQAPRWRGNWTRAAGNSVAGAAGKSASPKLYFGQNSPTVLESTRPRLGTYQLYLNGQRVGNDILAPGWTDYRKRIVYQVYDVTSQVKAGANAIGAILGGGWYADGLGWLQTRYNFGPPPVRLLVQLELEYADGTRDSVVSDESWKATQSPILTSEIYNGESYDARLEQNGMEPAIVFRLALGRCGRCRRASCTGGCAGFSAHPSERDSQAEGGYESEARRLYFRSRPEHGRLGAAACCR